MVHGWRATSKCIWRYRSRPPENMIFEISNSDQESESSVSLNFWPFTIVTPSLGSSLIVIVLRQLTAEVEVQQRLHSTKIIILRTTRGTGCGVLCATEIDSRLYTSISQPRQFSAACATKTLLHSARWFTTNRGFLRLSLRNRTINVWENGGVRRQEYRER